MALKAYACGVWGFSGGHSRPDRLGVEKRLLGKFHPVVSFERSLAGLSLVSFRFPWMSRRWSIPGGNEGSLCPYAYIHPQLDCSTRCYGVPWCGPQ